MIGMAKQRRLTMAVVRPHAPNVTEMALYAPVLEEFDVTYFFTGPTEQECRVELDRLGLERMKVRRYAAYTDIVSLSSLRRLLDFKVGVGSTMFSGVRHVLQHDIINVVDPIYMFAWQIVRRLHSRHRLIVVRWELIPGRYEDVWLVGRRAQRVLSRADLIVCTSEAARDTLPLYGGGVSARTRVEVIYPGVRLPNDVGVVESADQPRIVTVSRLQWQKGVDDLLAAVAILRRRYGTDALLTIIGDGDVKGYRRRAAALGLASAVEFTGRISNERARQHIASCDVYCQPSAVSRTWCEQFGFAVVEAMAYARPVVACRSGVLPEIVGQAGVYAAVRNAASLAQALWRVLSTGDDARRRGMRLRREACERYDAEKQGQALCRVLRDL